MPLEDDGIYPKLSLDTSKPLLNSTTTSLTNDRKPLTKRNRVADAYAGDQTKKNIEIAATYIQDAIHVRRPQTRIQENGLRITICSKKISFVSPLKCYRFVHNNYWKYFLFVVIWTHLLVIIFAPKNYEGRVPDQYNSQNDWVLIVQLLCVIIFIIDCALKVYSHDHEFRNNPWQRMLYFVITINIIHVVLSLLGEQIDQRIILGLQIVRPYYLIYNARSLRAVVKSILRAIPRIMILLWLIAFVVCAFGMVGYELMYDIKDSNWKTYEQSMLNLMILLTTANFPDVMMIAYHSSRLYVIFFACYVILILVLFLPTLLAVIYESYNSQTEKQYAKICRIHANTLLSAFELLTRDSTNCTIYTYTSIANDDDNFNQATISKETWLQLMRIIRPDMDTNQQEVLYTTLRLQEHHLVLLPDEVEYQLNNTTDNNPPGITRKQFLRLPEFIEIHFHISAKIGAAHELVVLRKEYTNYLRNRETRTLTNQFLAYETKTRIYLLYIFSNPVSEAVIDWMVWLTAVTLIAERFVNDVYDDDVFKTAFAYVHQAFLVIFVAEIFGKMYAFGIKAFLSDWFFIFDSFLVGIGVVALIISGGDDTGSYLTLIRTLRLLRILKQFPQVQLLSLFLASLMRSFTILLFAQFCVFYVYAQIGMILFDGKITRANMEEQVALGINVDYWNGILSNSSHPRYWLNNMNNFINTMIVLMELSVVNNWQCVMEMYIAMTHNHYYRLYFISFYFFSVILVLNVVIAFVINLFLVNYGQNISSNDLLFRYKRYIVMSILINQLNDNEYDISHWTIERRARDALWYQIIFEDRCNNSIENVNSAQKLMNDKDDDDLVYNIGGSVDYDDVVQMPWGQMNIIDQFNKYEVTSSKSSVNYNNPNDSSTTHGTQIFGSPNVFSGFSLNASYKHHSLNAFSSGGQRATPKVHQPPLSRPPSSQYSVIHDG